MTDLEHMQLFYLDKIRSLEVENKKLKEAARVFIDDVAEYGESFCNDVGHNPETCNECILKRLLKEEENDKSNQRTV